MTETEITEQQFQTFLDDISECFLSRDFDAWQARIKFPFSIVTTNGPEVFNTVEALRENFGTYIGVIDLLSIDSIYRIQVSLEDCRDGSWIGTYTTHMMSNGRRVTAPYTSSVLLTVAEKGPVMSSILNARGTMDWQSEVKRKFRSGPPKPG